MPSVETHIEEYIKEKATEMQDGIRIPLSRIAGDLDYSTVTVWRAIQKLKGKRVIKIVKSYNKTEPDRIYYIGEANTLIDTIDHLTERVNGILLALKELRDRANEQEDIIFKLSQR